MTGRPKAGHNVAGPNDVMIVVSPGAPPGNGEGWYACEWSERPPDLDIVYHVDDCLGCAVRIEADNRWRAELAQAVLDRLRPQGPGS